MDWQSLGPVMSTFEQIIVDGANGVTQAPRVVPSIPAWQICGTLLMIGVGASSRTRLVRRSAVVLMAASFVPGYWQILVRRADAPARQSAMSTTVVRVQRAYVARAEEALGHRPPGACYEPVRDASCVPYGGLHDGMAWALGDARRCIGGEPSRMILRVSRCSPADVAIAAVAP
jgi:hypothetical protein